MPPETPGTCLIRDATLPAALAPGAPARADILVRNGLVGEIAPAGTLTAPGVPMFEQDGGLVFPSFVDMHTHLDKGHIWPRRENPDGTFDGALLAVRGDREANWSAADVAARMEFSLRCAYAHGTFAIRTHLDSAPPQHAISFPLFAEMRERWAGRIELQAVALLGPDHLVDRAVLDEVAATAKAHGGLLGGAVSLFDGAPEAIAAVIDAAGRHDLDLDLHIDESASPAARSLRLLADTVLATGFPGRVVAGHCCSLAIHDEAFARETIARVAEAGIGIVSLPMCNLYLQDRYAVGAAVRTPRWRGVTLINELSAAGVKVAISSDNTRDPFYAYGDLDAVEVVREGARIAHLDHPAEHAFDWVRAVTSTPAELCGFSGGSIAVGAAADLVLFRARTWTELLARPQSDRVVIRAGAAIDRTLPDYRELDALVVRIPEDAA